MKKYYTLLIFRNKKWEPEFGSYDRDDVKQEQDEYPKKSTKIIITGDAQDMIDAKVNEINSKLDEV